MNWFSFSSQQQQFYESVIDRNEIHTNVRHQPLKPINLTELEEKYAKPGERRIAPRYPVEVQVLILSTHRSFRTKSENISESGILLKDLLPSEFMHGPIEVLLYDSKDNRASMIFQAATVGGPLRTRRLKFKATNLQSHSNLTQLLASCDSGAV